MRLASIGQRVTAQLLDAVPICAGSLLLWALLNYRRVEAMRASGSPSPGAMWMLALITAAVYVTYHTLCIGLRERTPGKAALGMVVWTRGGMRRRWGRALARSGVQILCAYVGLILWPVFAKLQSLSSGLLSQTHPAVQPSSESAYSTDPFGDMATALSFLTHSITAPVNGANPFLLAWLSLLWLPVLPMCFERHLRGIHDRVADTVVIVRRRGR